MTLLQSFIHQDKPGLPLSYLPPSLLKVWAEAPGSLLCFFSPEEERGLALAAGKVLSCCSAGVYLLKQFSWQPSLVNPAVTTHY